MTDEQPIRDDAEFAEVLARVTDELDQLEQSVREREARCRSV